MSNVTFPGLGLAFTINRVAFTVGDFEVYWYGIIIAFSMLVGIWLANKNAKTFGLDEDRMMDVILISAVFAVLSGRTFYVLFATDYTVSSVAEFFSLRGGGIAFYGVLLGALAASYIVCRIRKVRYTCLLDNIGIGFLVAQGIGRWGNFFNQEAFGTNTDLPWGMYSDTIEHYIRSNAARLLTEHGIVLTEGPVHPTFLYESIWCLLGTVLLVSGIKKRRFDGEIFLKYLIWNGVGRAFIEQLRTDALFLGRIRMSQLVCSLLAVSAALVLLAVKAKIRRLGDDEFLKPYGQTAECAAYFAELAQEREQKESNRKGGKSGADSESAVNTESAENAAENNSAGDGAQGDGALWGDAAAAETPAQDAVSGEDGDKTEKSE